MTSGMLTWRIIFFLALKLWRIHVADLCVSLLTCVVVVTLCSYSYVPCFGKYCEHLFCLQLHPVFYV